MAPRTPQNSRATPALPPHLASVNLHAAGLDSGADAHAGAVPPRDDPHPVRGVRAYTAAREMGAAWWTTGGMTTVALASTGVSWSPRCERLEARGVAVLRVDPHQVHTLQGRPKALTATAPKLARRLDTMLTHGPT